MATKFLKKELLYYLFAVSWRHVVKGLEMRFLRSMWSRYFLK